MDRYFINKYKSLKFKLSFNFPIKYCTGVETVNNKILKTAVPSLHLTPAVQKRSSSTDCLSFIQNDVNINSNVGVTDIQHEDLQDTQIIGTKNKSILNYVHQLKKSAVPFLFPKLRSINNQHVTSYFDVSTNSKSNLGYKNNIGVENSSLSCTKTTSTFDLIDYKTESTQTNIINKIKTESRKIQTNNVRTESRKTQTTPFGISSYENMKNKKGCIHYYTGLVDKERFELVLQTLGPAAYSLNYFYHQVNISIEDQFLITLIKLRRATPDFELAINFNTSRLTIQNIFITWINFMAAEWGELDIWPDKSLIMYYMPNAFKKTYPSTRVILDGTEISIQAPAAPHHRQSTFSTYKNDTTLKSIVGITPSGLIS